MPHSTSTPEAKDAVWATQLSQAESMRRKTSFKSLFFVFRSSKLPSTAQHNYNQNRDTFPAGASPSLSMASLSPPNHQQTQDTDNTMPEALTLSLPGCISSSSSTSSTSSFEFPSDTSTAATTPSTSSPSVLMRATDTAISCPSPAPSVRGEQLREPSCSTSGPTQSAPKSRAPVDQLSRHRALTPLATCQEQTMYLLPSPPPSPVLHERRNSFQPKRRSSVGRFLLRRGHQSSPDLTQFVDDSDEFLSVSMVPPQSARPLSCDALPTSHHVARSRSLRRKTDRADLEKPTSYSPLERIEHRSILDADPAGAGFYLYPKRSTPEPPKQQFRNSWSPGMGGDNGRRGRKEQARPRNGFRKTVTNQIIMEEEAGSYPYDQQSPNRPAMSQWETTSVV